jgi:ABC-type bacteriocin/lantibiotic exporter with double-glycine peptidase domain
MPDPVPRDTNPGLRDAEFASVLTRIAWRCGRGAESLRATQLIAEAREAWPGDERQMWRKWLTEAGVSLGLRCRSVTLSLDQAIDLAEDGAALVLWRQEESGPIVLGSAKGSRVTISRSQASHDEPIPRLRVAGELRLDANATHDWLVVVPSPAQASHSDHHASPVRRLFLLWRPERSDILTVVAFAFFAGLLSLATPIAVEALVTTVAFGRAYQPVLWLAVLLFGFLAFYGVMQALQAVVAEIIEMRLFARISADLAHRMPRVHAPDAAGYYLPELTNRFFDVVTIQKVTAQLLLDGIATVLATVIGMAVLAFYHPWLLGFDALLLVLVVVGLFGLGRGGIQTAQMESKYKYRLASWFEDIARCQVGFKLAGASEFALDRANHLTAGYLQHRRDHFRVLFRQLAFILVLQTIAGTVLLGFGGYLVIQGQLTLGQLVAAELIVAMILGSLAKVGKHIEGFFDATASIDKLGYLFDLVEERQDGLVHMPDGEGVDVSLHAVTHSSGGPDLAAGLSVVLSAGERVALYGPRNAGKRLVLDMLYGLLAPESGHVEIEGCDPRDLRPDILRTHVALARGPELFEGTIAENVHLHRPGVTVQEVRAALADVGLLGDILKLPQGLETPVNASGAPLSPSQVLLLMVARAIAGEPRLILLDGTLDALPDADAAKVFHTLVTRAADGSVPDWTAIVATGRQDIADRFDRVVKLAGPPPTDDESPMAVRRSSTFQRATRGPSL